MLVRLQGVAESYLKGFKKNGKAKQEININ